MSTRKLFCFSCTRALDAGHTVVDGLAYCSAHLADARARVVALHGTEGGGYGKPKQWTSPAGYVPPREYVAPHKTTTKVGLGYPPRTPPVVKSTFERVQEQLRKERLAAETGGFVEKDSIRVLCGPYAGRVGHITSLTSQGRTAHCVLDGIEGAVMAFNAKEIELACPRVKKQPDVEEYLEQGATYSIGQRVRLSSSTGKFAGLRGVIQGWETNRTARVHFPDYPFMGIALCTYDQMSYIRVEKVPPARNRKAARE